jgi:nitronate monooxygenase
MPNRFAEEMKAHEAALPPFPIQGWFVGTLREAAIAQGRTDLIALSAGQAAPVLRHRNARALMDELVRETAGVLARLADARG